MAVTGWTNNGHVMYDCALSWQDSAGAQHAIPFLWGKSNDFPYRRQSVETSERQVSTTTVAGEQSLDNWWYRSQSSFHDGANVEWFDTTDDPNLSNRFYDSDSVEVMQPGRVGLVREAALVDADVTGVTRMVGFTQSGGGVLYTEGPGLNMVTAAGAVSAVGGYSSNILSLVSDGGRYYVATTAGIYAGTLPNAPSSLIWSFLGMGVSDVTIGVAKDRIFCGTTGSSGSWMMELALGGTGTVPAFSETPTSWVAGQRTTWKHPTTGWAWTSVSDGASHVYASGYAGDKSMVYSMEHGVGESDDGMAIPVVAATMPAGEVIYSMDTYISSFLLLGTNAGLRVAGINVEGGIDLGPLSVETPNPVKAITAYGEFVICGGGSTSFLAGSNVTPPGVKDTATPYVETANSCLYKVDLSNQIMDKRGNRTGKFAYAKFVSPANGGGSSTATATGAAFVGTTGRVAFTVGSEGCYVESATDSAARGWLRTGKIRMDTWEPKIFQYIKTVNSVVDGHIEVEYRTDVDGTWKTLYSWDTDTVRSVSTDGSDFKPADWVQYRFILARGDTITNTPVLTGYQLRSQLSEVTQKDITLPLLCYYRERDRKGLTTVRSTWDRINELENAQFNGQVVRFQDFGTGEDRNVLVKDVQFISNHVPEQRQDENEPSGMLIVTVRTTDVGGWS